MSRSAIEQEIKALEKRLACGFCADDEVPELEVPPAQYGGDDLGQEIAALEEEIQSCEMRSAAHKSKGVVFDDADQELKALYDEINAEDQKTIEDGIEGKSGFFGGGENQNITGPEATPEAALMASERRQRRKAGEGDKVNNPEEPHGRGGLWQDKDVVEMEMGVDDLGEDTMDAAKGSTKFQDSEFIYAKNLTEASARLDRVASALEKRGGVWKKFAFRVDRIADAIDGERRQVIAKIASKRVAARKSEEEDEE